MEPSVGANHAGGAVGGIDGRQLDVEDRRRTGAAINNDNEIALVAAVANIRGEAQDGIFLLGRDGSYYRSSSQARSYRRREKS